MSHVATIFYKDLNGSATAKELADAVKKKGIIFTVKKAEAFLKSQEAVQVYKKLNDKNLYAPIVGDAGTYQADLLFLKLKKTEENDDLYPVLVVVEITSRKGYFRYLENKTGAVVARAMESIIAAIKAARQSISIIEHDSGSEFKAVEFLNVLVRNDIVSRQYPKAENSKTALAKVERLNGTIRTWWNKSFRGRMAPSRAVPLLEKKYNDRKHSATGMRPAAITNNADYTHARTLDEIKGSKARATIRKKYFVGLKVRIREPSDIFKKGSEQRWGDKVHTIVSQDGFSFKVDGRDETFRAWEMLPVDNVQTIPRAIKKRQKREEEVAIQEEEAQRQREEEAKKVEDAKRAKEEALEQQRLEEERNRKTKIRGVDFPIREYIWVPPKRKGHETLQIRVKWNHLTEEENKKYALQKVDIFFLGTKKNPVLNRFFAEDMKRKRQFARFTKAYGSIPISA